MDDSNRALASSVEPRKPLFATVSFRAGQLFDFWNNSAAARDDLLGAQSGPSPFEKE
jgi:hypothetical protein